MRKYKNESISNLKPISMGVPQGSILGPLFYVIYVNDFHYVVNCTPRLYADDTCLLVEGKTEEIYKIYLTLNYIIFQIG